MSNLETPSKEKANASPPMVTPATGPTPKAADIESQTAGNGQQSGVTAIIRKWNRDDKLKRGLLALRGIGLICSLISFIIMASNKHGGWEDFDKYGEYHYLLGIAILSTLYTAAQFSRQVHELRTGKQMVSLRMLVFIDFIGDQIIPIWDGSEEDDLQPQIVYQICSYLLMSAASSAIPLTNRMREGADNIFTDYSSSAISMALLAFFALALSALISGYKLSTYSYI